MFQSCHHPSKMRCCWQSHAQTLAFVLHLTANFLRLYLSRVKVLVHGKIKRKVQRLPTYPPPPLATSRARGVHSYRWWTYNDTSLPPEANSWHDIRVSSWSCTISEFWQMYNNMYPPWQNQTEQLHCLKTLCVPSTLSSTAHPNPWQPLILSRSSPSCLFQKVIELEPYSVCSFQNSFFDLKTCI